jgi:conjugative relaxase-like TrwC/TraI family protein
VVAVMSISRLSAGAGYRYLLRNVASHDVERVPTRALVEYYALSGNPPGRWVGAGLPGLGTGDGGDLRPGAVVTEEAMGRLFGTGHDPVSGGRLGLAYPKFRSIAERTATRVGRLPEDLPASERAALVAEIEAQENARPVRSAVAGFDLTFTVPKSVSVLWALGDEDVRQAVESAHRDAVAAVLGLIEDRFLHTRIGAGSKIRVPARGGIAAAFDHWDTRAGDPNLHTHLVIANKVQGPDGRWRAVDGQVLFAAAVACSEIYDSTIADLLATRLPVSVGYRDRGPRRTAAYEIDGIPDPLLAAFSSRSAAIGTHLQDLVAAFTDAHGREPNRIEVLRLRQQATLATRPDKQVSSLAELQARWRTIAETVTGQPVDRVVREALTSTSNLVNNLVSSIVTTPAVPSVAGEIPEALLGRYADATVTAVATRRATWTQTNLLAEAARVTRALRLPNPDARITLLDRVVAAAVELCVALDPPTDTPSPHHYAAAEALTGQRDASAEAPEPAYTSWEILAAEARLLSAHTDDTTAPVGDAQSIAKFAASPPVPGRPRLSAEQADAAAAIAGSARRLDVLVGPAGAGKTRALCALRAGWEYAHGAGSVIGLAPSAAAAAVLGTSVGIGADTLAKWILQSDPNTAIPTGIPPGSATAGDEPWRLRAGQMVIVDEAAMAPTAHLDALLGQASAAGAKVVLVGDHCQLGAVETGGAFALLAGEGNAVELEQLHRFTHEWEAHATRALRIGDPAVLDTYTAHGRLHDGPQEAMTERAYRAWATDIATGRDSLLLAPDRDTVTALNRRARGDRIRACLSDSSNEVALHDGTAAGAGDLITTRRNNRCLTRPDGGHVRNGDRWQIGAVHPDGSLDAIPDGPSDPRPARGVAVRLPADYVRDHVELGYATTIHRAQGATADTAHLVAREGMTREALYVGLTRGRHANYAYVVTDLAGVEHGAGDKPPGRQVLEAVLRSSASETAATSVLRHRQIEHVLALGRTGQWPPQHAGFRTGVTHEGPFPPTPGITR